MILSPEKFVPNADGKPFGTEAPNWNAPAAGMLWSFRPTAGWAERAKNVLSAENTLGSTGNAIPAGPMSKNRTSEEKGQIDNANQNSLFPVLSSDNQPKAEADSYLQAAQNANYLPPMRQTRLQRDVQNLSKMRV